MNISGGRIESVAKYLRTSDGRRIDVGVSTPTAVGDVLTVTDATTNAQTAAWSSGGGIATAATGWTRTGTEVALTYPDDTVLVQPSTANNANTLVVKDLAGTDVLKVGTAARDVGLAAPYSLTTVTGAANFSGASIDNKTGQQDFTVAVGTNAGLTGQQNGAVAVGFQAGRTNQGTLSVAAGYQAGYLEQGGNSVALGAQAQRLNRVALTPNAAVSIGYEAGKQDVRPYAIGIGFQAGAWGAMDDSIAIGRTAGRGTDPGQGNDPNPGVGTGAVCIGASAGAGGGGDYSISLGYNTNLTGPAPNNSITLNATGSALEAGKASSVYLAPIAQETINTGQTENAMVTYNADTKELATMPVPLHLSAPKAGSCIFINNPQGVGGTEDIGYTGDTHAVIQRAVDALEAQGGGTIFLGNGDYNLSTTAVTFAQNTNYLFIGTHKARFIVQTAAHGFTVDQTGVDLEFRGISFQRPNGDSNAYGRMFNLAVVMPRFAMTQCIYDGTGCLYSLTTLTSLIVDRCIFDATNDTTTSSNYDYFFNVLSGPTLCLITNSEFKGRSTGAIAFSALDLTGVTGGYPITLTNCIFNRVKISMFQIRSTVVMQSCQCTDTGFSNSPRLVSAVPTVQIDDCIFKVVDDTNAPVPIAFFAYVEDDNKAPIHVKSSNSYFEKPSTAPAHFTYWAKYDAGYTITTRTCKTEMSSCLSDVLFTSGGGGTIDYADDSFIEWPRKLTRFHSTLAGYTDYIHPGTRVTTIDKGEWVQSNTTLVPSWIPVAPGLTNLWDVNAPTPSGYDGLMYVGSQWINMPMRMAIGELYFQGSQAYAISDAYQVLDNDAGSGTIGWGIDDAIGALYKFDETDGNGSLTYKGSIQQNFHVAFSLSGKMNGAGDIIVALSKNRTTAPLQGSESTWEIGQLNNSFAYHKIVEMQNGDSVNILIKHSQTGQSGIVTFNNCNLCAMGSVME